LDSETNGAMSEVASSDESDEEWQIGKEDDAWQKKKMKLSHTGTRSAVTGMGTGIEFKICNYRYRKEYTVKPPKIVSFPMIVFFELIF
jgi:hypothetical protein